MKNPIIILLLTCTAIMGATYNKVVVTKDGQSSFTQPSTVTVTNDDLYLAPGGKYHGDGSLLTGISSGSTQPTFTNVASALTNTIDWSKSSSWCINPFTNNVTILTVNSSNLVNGVIWFVSDTSDHNVVVPSQWGMFDGSITNTASSNKVSYIAVEYKGVGETNAVATFRTTQ